MAAEFPFDPPSADFLLEALEHAPIGFDSDDPHSLWTWPGGWLVPQAQTCSVNNDDESQDSDSTLDFEDGDGRLAGITGWTHRAASWRAISDKLRKRWQETVTVDVPIQQLAQDSTQTLHPTASDSDWGLQPIFEPTPLYEHFDKTIETLHSFSVRAQHAWCEAEEGPQHRQIVLELFTSFLSWICIASIFPDSLPCEFALPSPAIVHLMCRYRSPCHLWELWIRPRMTKAGAVPSQCTTNELQYPYDLTVWDAQGLLSNVAFEAWEEANSASLAALREFWREQVPTLLGESYQSLTKIFDELDGVLRILSPYGE